MAPMERITDDMRGKVAAGARAALARGTRWMRPRASDGSSAPDARPRRPPPARAGRGFACRSRRLVRAASTIADTGASCVLATHGWSDALAISRNARLTLARWNP